jgi:tetratricopeptide (TPR) repeat protein
MDSTKSVEVSKKLAYKYFYEARYEEALREFSLALSINCEDYDLKVGALLSDYAKEDEGDAIILIDFYESSVALGDDKSTIYENILHSIDYSDDLEYDMLDSVESLLAFDNGIDYSDFIKMAQRKGDIKRSLEDIMFSSKLIISNKEDMVSFINLLMQNDFKDEALSYLESAIMIYPKDSYFEEQFKELTLNQ